MDTDNVPTVLPREATTPVMSPAPITPEQPLQFSLSRMVSIIIGVATIVALAVIWGVRLEGRVSATEKDVGNRAETTKVVAIEERCREQLAQAATKADLAELASELREAFMSAELICANTRNGMECVQKPAHMRRSRRSR